MFATMILADMGADVLMVERPMDEARAAYERIVADIETPEDERRHASFNALQRNKRSIALQPQGAGGAARFSISWPPTPTWWWRVSVPAWSIVSVSATNSVKEINPRAVYCSVSGYGQTGPYSQMAGHDINYISFAGAFGTDWRLPRRQTGHPAQPHRRLRWRGTVRGSGPSWQR